jgi:hypothetical protein
MQYTNQSTLDLGPKELRDFGQNRWAITTPADLAEEPPQLGLPDIRQSPAVSPSETGGDGELEAADPTTEANRIVEQLNAGVTAVIAACERTKNALDRFEPDQRALEEFTGALMRARVITPVDALLGARSPKLSKFRKIGEHAHRLRDNRILPLLQPGYSVLYEVVTLYEALAGSETEKTDRLVRILQGCEGGLSRDYLIAEKKRVKRTLPARAPGDAQAAPGLEDSQASPTVSHLAEAGKRADLLLMTPGREDVRRLAQHYADEATLPRCLSLHQFVAESAIAVVITRVRDLPVIAGRLLPHCGFPRLSRVLLMRRPDEPDIADAEVIVTAERGRRPDEDLALPQGGTWPAEMSGDPTAIADRLVPNAVNKLHVFASTMLDGWQSLVGPDSWAEKPSLG